ncbi:amidohydrolase family protein [Actinomadura sp. GTD37]|uniref:amidohydrolase family protein n=1 Tax=Actinomadura sp. GTD37 TaxID=1778030 RepID=UPI0035C0D183
MPSRELPFPLFDADNHLYETEDAFTRYLPKEYQGAIEYVQVRGRTKIAIRGQISDYIPNPTFEKVARPGAQEDYFKNGNPEGKSYREIVGRPIESIPAFREPGPRLELMDEQGISRSLMFPTLASLLEDRMRDDPELTHAAVHSLNRWLDDVWSFNYRDRIYTAPVITLPIVEEAVRELEWCLERGARVVLVRPAPAFGVSGPRSVALPEFDPFWKLVQDSGTMVAFHSSDSGYQRYTADWEGKQREYLPFTLQPFREIGQWRAIEDTVASLICHGCLSRFPDLKIATIETGSSWVGPLLEKLRTTFKKMPQGFQEDPVEQMRRLIHVSPFIEDDMAGLADLLGVDRVLFGSDFPHPEGKADPITYVDDLGHLDEPAKAKIMGGNLSRLLPV